MEVWKDIKGYEGMYRVSNKGRVKSVDRFVKTKGGGFRSVKERFLKHGVDRSGYYIVSLAKENKSTTRNIHQLVAVAFMNHNPCGFKKVIDHINNNKKDNKVSNLQIITVRENVSKDRSGGTSIYTGVCWNKRKKMWDVNITIDGKFTNLGFFEDELIASNTYQEKLKEITA